MFCLFNINELFNIKENKFDHEFRYSLKNNLLEMTNKFPFLPKNNISKLTNV